MVFFKHNRLIESKAKPSMLLKFSSLGIDTEVRVLVKVIFWDVFQGRTVGRALGRWWGKKN